MKKNIAIFIFLLAPLTIALLLRSTVDIDRFENIVNYDKIGVKLDLLRFDLDFLDLRRGGQLNVNYSYDEELATDTTWGAGIKRAFSENGVRDLTTCTAVQIKVKGDGSLNAFHFELVETEENQENCEAFRETWASPDISLFDTTWQTMLIPMSHFRRLSDDDSKSTIDDYYEGDSCFVPKVDQYHFIFTGKVETDTGDYSHFSEFKGIDAQPLPPLLPMIDDFELNSTVPYPVPFGEALPKIQFNWSLRQSGETALQVYFNPYDTELPGPAAQGGIRTILTGAIDLSNYSSIGFHLKGDGSANSVQLQLFEKNQSGGQKIIISPPIALEDTAWQFIEIPLICFSTLENPLDITNTQLFLSGYAFVFSGQDQPDERKDFIFIDALRLGTTGGETKSGKSPVIDSFEEGVLCGLEEFGPCFLEWTRSNTATEGSRSLAINYKHHCPDSVTNQWGAGLRRVLPHEIDCRYFKKIEFDLCGDGSQNHVRLELVESQQAPADGETWASEFIDLSQQSWQRVILSLDEDLTLLLDRTDDVYPDYVSGNQTRDHRFLEYHLVFTGQDSTPEGGRVLIDHIRLSGREKPDHSTSLDSLVISEPRFSPLRGNVIIKAYPNASASIAGVELRIYRSSGDLVAQIASGSPKSSGAFVMQWDGRNSNGLTLPNGLYIMWVKTRDNAGREHDGLDHPKFVEILK